MNVGKAEASVAAHRRLVVFSLADQGYAISLDVIREIVPMTNLAQPPGLPTCAAGFLDREGRAVAVVSLRQLFRMPGTPPELYTPLLVLNGDPISLALMVDRVDGVVDLPGSQVVPLPSGHSFNNCALELATVDDALVILLSPDRILLDQERRRLAELAVAVEARLGALEEQPA